MKFGEMYYKFIETFQLMKYNILLTIVITINIFLIWFLYSGSIITLGSGCFFISCIRVLFFVCQGHECYAQFGCYNVTTCV